MLCDGGSDGKGGTVPDLRGRMIMGVSDTYKAGSTGGSVNHSHSLSGTVGDTTLTEKQLASHKHSYSKGETNRAYSGGGVGPLDRLVTDQTGATGGSQPHTHTLSGASGDADSLPPYYALALIMRIA